MSLDVKNSFKEKLYECNRHVQKIGIAKKHISDIIPLSIDKYQHMNDEDSSFIDQMIFRFSKLQDTIGEKIFPSILKLSKEDVKRKTFIDILNRLEELEVIDKNRWLRLREIRNEIAHEYSFNTQEIVDSINDIYMATEELIDIYNSVYDFSQKKFSLR